MRIRYLLIFAFLANFNVLSQDDLQNENSALKQEINRLQNRVKRLEEIQGESSLAIRGLFKDSFLGKRSQSFLRLSYGISSFTPDDIEEDNARALNSVSGGAQWGNFSVGFFLDLNIGKKILLPNKNFVNVSIGFQHWQSETIDGSFTSGSNTYQLEEKVRANSIFIRAAILTEFLEGHQLGGGISVGYTPSASINYSISQGTTGVTAIGKGDGALFEPYAIYEYALSQHFNAFARAGYRIHNIKNVTLNVADLITQTSTVDIDMSGLFSSVGLSMNF